MNILVGSTAVAFVGVIAANPDIWFETGDSSADALERLGGVAIIFGAMAASAIVGTEYGEITLSDSS